MTAFRDRERQALENEALAQEIRRMKLENVARELALLERAAALGVAPIISHKIKIARSG